MGALRTGFLGIGLAALLPLAPAAAQTLACTAPRKPMLEVELMFGRHVGGRLGVTEARWRDFLAREVTPRFPDGLTVLDAAGQWREARTGRTVREPSKLVRLVVPADVRTDEKIGEVVTAYKERFRQDAVGVLTRPACASF
jgi:hypothetical protein